jgi:small subunit ribosomal protein S6e
MANFKIVVSDPNTRKAYQKEVDQAASGLAGKKIGETFKGDSIGLAGYELAITGGSDKEGFPMRPDVEGERRKRVVLSQPPGFHPTMSGQRRRKSVRGNTVSVDIVQLNVKVTKAGTKSLEDLLGKKEEPKAEEKKEAPKEEPKAEEKPTEEPKKKEAPKEEKPVEAPKEEAKPEAPAEEKKEEKPAEEPKPEAPKEEAKPEEKPKEEK